MVRRTPAPLVSMEPPSRTMRWGLPLASGDLGLDLGEVVELGDAVGNLVVAMPVVVLGPGVELPVGDGEVCRLASSVDEDGAGVAQPDAVGGPVVEVEAGEVGAAAAKDAVARRSAARSLTRMWTSSTRGEMADDLGVDPGDGLELAGPVVGVVGPGDPGGGVRLPLGGHADWGVVMVRRSCGVMQLPE